MSQPRFAAVVFDVDGLIVDTEEIYYSAFNATLAAHGGGLAREGYAPYVGHPVADNSVKAVEQYRLDVSPEAFCRQWMDRFEATIGRPEQIRLMPGVLEVVAHVREGGYRLGIASSTPRQRMLTTLTNGLLYRLPDVSRPEEVFASILSGSEVTHHKPHPEIYQRSAQQLGVAAGDCLAFEDSQVGVEAAKAAGMFVVGVPNFYTRQQDHSAADVVVEQIDEVLARGLL